MANPRTWNLRLNLDEFNALAASLFTDGDRALALQGLALGMNAGLCPDNVPDSFRRGWAIGSGMRAEADEFRSAQADRGKASAAKRLERNGSAQPQKGPGSRTETEPPFEQWFEPPLEPNHNPQSTIQETNNDKQHPPTPRGGPPSQVSEVVEIWNSGIEGAGLPKARATDKRNRVIATRLRERGWIEDFRVAVASVASSPWHRGGNDRGWVADIDYLLQAGKATQIAEKAGSKPIRAAPSGPPGRPGVKWTGFDQTNYDQAKDQCRKDANGNFLL